MDDLEKIMASDFKIWKNQMKIFNKENLEKLLSRLNRICGPRFYILDYFQGRIIVDDTTLSPDILGGYSKEFIEEKGFKFFDILFDPEERKWSGDIHHATFDIFCNTPVENRTSWVLSYDLTIKRIDGHKVIVHHRLMPFILDDRGNMWFALAYVVVSGQKKFGNPTLANKKTNVVFEYIDGKFVKKATVFLSDEERMIIDYMVKGYIGDHIAAELGISASSLRRKKFLLYQRVGVSTNAELIHWAHLNGII